jgi:uncharacterized glyoxalase superfamily protein PhnB
VSVNRLAADATNGRVGAWNDDGAPATVATPDGGVGFQFTLDVEDVDATVDELKSRGVELLNGPMDRPWGSAPPASAIRAATSGRSPTSAS